MSDRIDFRVPAAGAGARLDVLVAERPEVGSRADAQRLIAAGAVTVDGQARPKRHVPAAGALVSVEIDARDGVEAVTAAAGGDVTFAIAYEDEHLIVVDKPAGLVVHPAPGHRSGTLAQALAGRAAGGGEPARAGIVHRLDRDTSGLLVVAKSDEVHRALQRQLRERRITRAYLALVDGRPRSRSGTIDAPLGRDRRRRTVMSSATDRPRGARTHFTTLEDLPASTLLEVRLETGRTHQIRAHLAAIGHPVVGDPQYGGGERRLGLRRQFLHSARLELTHPVTGEPLSLRSPLPEDLAEALERARGEPRAA